MSDVSFTYSDGGVFNMLNELKTKEIRRIERKSLSRTAGLLKRSVKQTFKKELPAATQTSEKYSDKLIDAIRSTVYEEQNEMMVKVHAMGSRKKDSGTFRARFWAVGTKERDGDGHYRGSIKATNFFSKGIDAASSKAVQTLNKTYTSELQKVIDKKYTEQKI